MNNRPYISDGEARELICELGARAYEKGLVCAVDGNISLKVADDQIWATPTGVSKGHMRPDMLVKMSLDGAIIRMGERGPSSEIKMHLRVYRENPDVRSVIHTHPPYGTAYAIAGKALDTALLAENVTFLGVIPCAPYATPGTQEVPDSVAPFCRDYNGCFLGNHGVLTWGDYPEEAFYRLESLEHACRIGVILNGPLRQITPLSEKDVQTLYAIRDSLGYTRGGTLKIAETT